MSNPGDDKEEVIRGTSEPEPVGDGTREMPQASLATVHWFEDGITETT